MQARDHLYERHSVLKGHEILAEALNQNLGASTWQRLKLCLTSDQSGITRLAESSQNPLLSCQWASQRGLELERWSIQFVNQTQRSCSPLGTTQGVEFDFKSQEQRTAVLETLQTTDRVYAIRGCAGAGKTTCLQEIQKGLEAAGTKSLLPGTHGGCGRSAAAGWFHRRHHGSRLPNQPGQVRSRSDPSKRHHHRRIQPAVDQARCESTEDRSDP